MNPVLSEMSDENDWWLSKFFVLKKWWSLHESLIKHYDLQKMNCFIKIQGNKEFLETGYFKIVVVI